MEEFNRLEEYDMQVIRLRKGPAAFREYARNMDYEPKGLLAESNKGTSEECGHYFVVEEATEANIEDMGWAFRDTVGTYDILTGWNVREIELYRRKRDSAVFVEASKL